jgi:hypothetical protein
MWAMTYSALLVCNSTDKDSATYIPKSKRSQKYEWMKSWMKRRCNKIGSYIEAWSNHDNKHKKISQRWRALDRVQQKHTMRRWHTLIGMVLPLVGINTQNTFHKAQTRVYTGSIAYQAVAMEARSRQTHPSVSFDTDSAPSALTIAVLLVSRTTGQTLKVQLRSPTG